MPKSEKLNILHQKARDCRNCILRSTCSQVVPGEGNPEAEILFIGEGPGK